MTRNDPNDLRKALGCFLTGVTVITTREPDGTPRGFTANSFTSVSLDPPLVLVCLAKSASSFNVFEHAADFAVNILAENQREISGSFASKKVVDKFHSISLEEGRGSSPILSGVVSWLSCSVHEKIDAGDHIILVGKVTDYSYNDISPLGFYSGNYIEFGIGRQAIQVAAEHPTSISGIFERDGRILLIKKGSRWELPTGKSLGELNSEQGSLFALLNKMGIEVSVTFVFSIAQDENTGQTAIFYRGEVSVPVRESNTIKLVAFDDMPWSELRQNPPYREMLERYFKERAEARFGVYVGSTSIGRVRTLDTNY